MNAQTNDFLMSLIKEVVLPEVLVAVRTHRNATGVDPTAEQVLAALDVKGMAVRQQGQSFLDSIREPVPPPQV